MSQTRVPRGTNQGGQFATSQRGEAVGVRLAGDTGAILDDLQRSASQNRRGTGVSRDIGNATISFMDYNVRDADGFVKPFGSAGFVSVTTRAATRSFEFGTNYGEPLDNEEFHPDYEAARTAAAAWAAEHAND